MKKTALQILEEVVGEGNKLLEQRRRLKSQYYALDRMQAVAGTEGSATTLMITQWMNHGLPAGTFIAVPNVALKKIILIIKEHLDVEHKDIESNWIKLAACLRLLPDDTK